MGIREHPRAVLPRWDQRDLTTYTVATWLRPSMITGGACGILGACAGTAQLFNMGPGTELCLCAGSVACAVITATVAIVGIVTSRSPEVRRMAALRQLALQAATPRERQSAMAMLTLDKAIACGQIKDTAALTEALCGDTGGERPNAVSGPPH